MSAQIIISYGRSSGALCCANVNLSGVAYMLYAHIGFVSSLRLMPVLFGTNYEQCLHVSLDDIYLLKFRCNMTLICYDINTIIDVPVFPAAVISVKSI